MSVEPGEEALWRAAAEVVAAEGRVRRLEEQAAGPRSWEGYARVLWEAARHRMRTCAGGLSRGRRSVGRCGRAAGAAGVVEGAGAFGDRAGRLTGAAPAARAATSVSGACDAVAADGNVQRKGQEVAAAVL
ncbi:hypothetical protein OG512_48165 [Streptomyces sp. NBC_01378]|uniref:hypothetical protein n=1 Tax=Streptomyces sp. NBC_01378 TaxID=2903844 RepID=UPI0032561A89